MADARSGAELTDYSKVAFSADGVRQEISIDDWRNGWAAIVGGLNGKPTRSGRMVPTSITAGALSLAAAMNLWLAMWPRIRAVAG